MLRTLTVGFHTEHLEQLMQSFEATNEAACIDVLHQIQKKKEYMGPSQLAQSFVNKIEYTVLHKQKFVTSQTLYLYNLLKKLELLTGSFRFSLYGKLERQLNGILEYDLNVRNNELETLLWFMYREYPFQRSTRTLEIASEHSLKLFDIVEYMNNQKTLPKWDPYLRVVTLLKDLLGHEIDGIRTDITRDQIQKLNYLYIPYLKNLFDKDEDCQKFQSTYHTYKPFFVYLAELYIDKDRYVHDEYLQYVEIIDNQRHGQQIQRYYATLTWPHFAQFFDLYCRSVQLHGINEELVYNVDELFWRVAETSNIELETAIILIKLISKNHKVMDKYEGNMFNRAIEGIKSCSVSEFTYISANALYQLLIAVDSMESLDKAKKKQIFEYLTKIIKRTKNWGNTNQSRQLLSSLYQNNQYGIELDSKTKKILQIN